MPNLTPEEPKHEDLLREAQTRLAEKLGGQWAVYAARETPDEVPAVEIVSQRQISIAEVQNNQRLVELGMLAAGTDHRQLPYFVR